MSGTLTILAVTLPTLLLATAVARTRTTQTTAESWPRAAGTPDDGVASFCRALLKLYGVLAIALVLMAAVETRAGMFEGLTIGESILKATGTDLSGGGPLM